MRPGRHPLLRGIWLSLMLLFLLPMLPGKAAGEILLSLSTEEAQVGEVVDVTVQAGEKAASVRYTLTVNGKTVFAGEEDSHFVSSFRPRMEGAYELQVTVKYTDGTEADASASVSVSGTAEEQRGPDVIYSQKDGWWETRKYGKSELQKAGCAIFTLSHALQRMGWTGEDVLPETLAKTYAGCYTQGGTANARLITRASEVYGYSTRKELISGKANIRNMLQKGDLFSFSIVTGHIALVAGLDPDGRKALIVDSAPGATFERIRKGKIYYLEDGTFCEAKDPGSVPGARYYFETGEWGGLQYYMDLDYLARREVRLIRPVWLFMKTENGLTGVTLQTLGTASSTVVQHGKEQEVPTAELIWNQDGSAQQIAWIQKKSGARLLNESGKRIDTVPACALLPVFEVQEGRILVIYDENRGTISAEDAVLLTPAEARPGQISLKGNTSGRAKVKMRFGASTKEKVMAEWKTGTAVSIILKESDFYLVEAQGLRLWVQEDFLTAKEE